MKKRIMAVVLSIAILFSDSASVFACDRKQTETYVSQMLFGDKAEKYKSNEKVQMLMKALYLCSEQYDDNDTKELDALKKKKVSGLPKSEEIEISQKELLECSHNTWEYKYNAKEKQQRSRKTILRNTVSKVFGVGFWNRYFKRNKEKYESFAAVLYYMHILADYLADDPDATEITWKSGFVSAYDGKASVEINGGIPQFTQKEKNRKDYFLTFSKLDSSGRAGTAFANISKDHMPEAGSRQHIGNIKPSGWNQKKYDGIVSSNPGYVYNRCHLIAHQLVGEDIKENLITGTRYLNEAMIPTENEVADYVQKTGNHVLYRVTPVYKGENLLASGIQIEAYSVEDKGKGILENRYFYNVQPGIEINYNSGENSCADTTFQKEKILKFVTVDSGEKDLVHEMNKQLDILFKDQKKSKKTNDYNRMMSAIDENIRKVRNVGNKGETAGKQYILRREYEYEYYKILRKYLPSLLEQEQFFSNVFRD